MCAIVDSKKTLQLYKRKKRIIKVYKVMEINSDHKLVSQYRMTEYQPGINEAKQTGKICQTKHGKSISQGIHVYLDKKTAENAIFWFPEERIVQFEANLDDLICVGRFGSKTCAVFKKVKLSKVEYYKALK